VPVYLCESGGDVVVNIAVARDGSVTSANVDGKKSAAHPCIREAARQAALLSRFSASDLSKSQQGVITYRFVPQ
jgi:TonB family protein